MTQSNLSPRIVSTKISFSFCAIPFRKKPSAGKPIKPNARCNTPAYDGDSSALSTTRLSPGTNCTPAIWPMSVTFQPPSFRAPESIKAKDIASALLRGIANLTVPRGFALRNSSNRPLCSAVKSRSFISSFNFSKAASALAALICCLASSVCILCCSARAFAASISRFATPERSSRFCCASSCARSSNSPARSFALPAALLASPALSSAPAARSFAFAALSPASAIRALASARTVSWYVLFARHNSQASSAPISAATTPKTTESTNSLRCALSASATGDWLDWLADRLDWTVAIAFTILATGVIAIASLAIRDRLTRSKTIKREEREKRKG